MLSNHLFWLAVALLVWSGFNINTAVGFKGSSVITKKLIQWAGVLGIIAGLIRVVSLSIYFDWWWLPGIIIAFFIIIGIVLALLKGVSAIVFSILGLLGIPIIWWIGGVF